MTSKGTHAEAGGPDACICGCEATAPCEQPGCVHHPDRYVCPECDTYVDEDGYCTSPGCPNEGKTVA